MESEESLSRELYKKMASLCSNSEHCSSDIRKKLKALGGHSIMIEKILQQLEEEKFLDDRRYTKAYISDKFRMNKWGRIKLRYYLKMKNLSDTLIEEGLTGMDEKMYRDVLIKTMKEKARMVKNKPKFEKLGQIIRFAQNRGFEPELIHRYMNEAVE